MGNRSGLKIQCRLCMINSYRVITINMKTLNSPVLGSAGNHNNRFDGMDPGVFIRAVGHDEAEGGKERKHKKTV